MSEAAAKKQEPELVESAEGGRERSTIGFPYLDLDDAVEIAKGVHTVGGSNCQWDQLAAQLNQAASGGGFRMRVQTAKLYGVLTYDRGTVTLTPLGQRICDAEQEKAARAESFLTIPLYKAIYEQFKGGTLPPPSGLETAMVTLGVAQKQKDKARQVFQRSAQQAGFFAFGTNKLVMPSVKNAAAATPAIELEREPEPDKKKKKDEDEGERRHPLIEGLLKELPEPQSEWTTEDRKRWLEMASTIFNVIYKDSEEGRGTLRVTVEKSSARQ
jgi:hypothetical protein